MSPAWTSKVPWARLAEFFLNWWKTKKEKKNDSSQGDGKIQTVNDKPPVDIKPA